MRSTLLVLAALAAAGVAAARWPVADTHRLPAALQWVRTADGWERTANLMRRAGPEPRLHPFTLAAFQVLGAGAALAAAWRRGPA